MKKLKINCKKYFHFKIFKLIIKKKSDKLEKLKKID